MQLIKPNSKVTEVFLNSDGFIQIIYHGLFDKQEGLDIINYVMILVHQLKRQNSPINVLADTRGMTGYSHDAKHSGVRARQLIPFKKMAIVVNNPQSEMTILSKKLTNKFADNRRSINYFETEEAATHWLKR